MKELFVFAFSRIKQYKSTYLIAFLIIFITTLLQLPVPFLFKKMIDSAVYSHELSLFVTISMGIVLITFAREAGRLLSNVMLERKVIEIVKDVKVSLMQKFLKHARYPHEKEGYVVSRVYDEPDDLRDIFFDMYVILLKSILLFVFGIFALLFISVKLTVILLFYLPIYILVTSRMKKTLNVYMQPVMESDAIAREQLTNIAGMPLEYKLYDKNGLVINKTDRVIDKVFKAYYKYVKYAFSYDVILNMLTDIIPVSIVVLGVYEIYRGRLTAGGLFAFTSMQNYLINPIQSVMNLRIGLVKSYTAFQRINKFAETENSSEIYVSDSDDSCIVNLMNVSMNIGERRVLDRINLNIKHGEKILITGENGSGKTMLLRVLCGFVKNLEGKVRFCVNPYKDISAFIDSATLFKGTLLENIVFNMSYKDERLREVINIVNFDLDRYGLDYLIDVNGKNFSQGERQKILLARTLYKEAKVYIFDEPIEHIPYKEALIIYEKIIKFIGGNTLITVAHRSHDLKLFHDRTLKLNHGKITGSEVLKNADEDRRLL